MTQTANFVGLARVNNGELVRGELQITSRTRVIRSDFPIREPDPAWIYEDAAGHFHSFDVSPRNPTPLKVSSYPTLEQWRKPVSCSCDAEYFEDGEETHTELAYRCRICREEIEPVLRTADRETLAVIADGTEWEVVVHTSLYLPRVTTTIPYDVTVRIAAAGVEFFGVASVTNLELSSEGNRSWLRGVSELGRRKGRNE